MRCECPDSRFFADLADLNGEFLALIRRAASRGQAASVLGLRPEWVAMLASLDEAQLRFVATTPCLLASFGQPPDRVGDALPPEPFGDPAWHEAVRLYAVAMLSFLRTATGRDRLEAALCVGPPGEATNHFAAMSIGSIRSHATDATLTLRARFADVPSFWPDLVRAARCDDAEFRNLSRLRAIPMICAPAAPPRLRRY